ASGRRASSGTRIVRRRWTMPTTSRAMPTTQPGTVSHSHIWLSSTASSMGDLQRLALGTLAETACRGPAFAACCGGDTEYPQHGEGRHAWPAHLGGSR